MAGTARVFSGTAGSPIGVAGDNVLIYGSTALIQAIQVHDGLEGGTVGWRVNSSGHGVVHQANDGTVSVTGTPNVHVTNAATVTLTGTNPVTLLNNGTVIQGTNPWIVTANGGTLLGQQGTVIAHVSNNGTVAVSSIAAGDNNIGNVDVASLPGNLTGFAEDAGHSSGDVGIQALGVRKNEPAALAGADADYTPLITDASGALWTHANDGTVAIKGNVLVGNNGTVTLTGTNPVFVTNNGTVSVSSIAAGDNNIGNVDVLTLPGGITGFAEDAAHSSGDVGVPAMAVRKNEPAALAGADADYTPLTSDAVGAAWTHVNDGTVAIKGNVLVGNNGTVTLTGTNPVFVTNNGTVSVSNLRVLEDDPHASGDPGIQALAVRRDTPTSGAAAGDYHHLEVDERGGLWTNTVNSGTSIHSSVAGTITMGTLLTASGSRLGYTIHNDSDNILYLRHGDGAASTAYNVRMPSQSLYEVPFRYTGLVTGVWSANGGSAHVGDMRAS